MYICNILAGIPPTCCRTTTEKRELFGVAAIFRLLLVSIIWGLEIVANIINAEVMKILKIDMSRLHNGEHFQIMSELLQVLHAAVEKATQKNTDDSSFGISSLLEIFVSLLETEDRTLNNFRKSVLTDPIADKDKMRDMVFRGFLLYVHAYSHSMYDEKRDAARRLQVLIYNYGDFRRENYVAESSFIYNFLQDIEEKHSGNIVTIGAEEWIESLRIANDEFKRLMDERFDERQEAEKTTVKEARKQVDAIYRQVAAVVEIAYTVSRADIYADLISRMNKIIGYYKTSLAQRKGRADARK